MWRNLMFSLFVLSLTGFWLHATFLLPCEHTFVLHVPSYTLQKVSLLS